MEAKDIDSNGFWNSEKGKVNLLESMIPVPESIRVAGEIEYCLFLSQANHHIRRCPDCRLGFDDDTILLVLENVRLLPAKCCNMMFWYVEQPYQLAEDCEKNNWREMEENK